MTAYQELHARFHRIGLLGEAGSVLDWDSATMMPTGSAAARADQQAALAVLVHELRTDPRIGELIEVARPEGDWQSANLLLIRAQYLHATAVPADLVEALARASSECEVAWRSARPANDFGGLRPKLERVLALTREVAQAKSAALGLGLYDALLDQYDPGRRSAEIDHIFADLAAFLPGFTRRVLDAQAARPAPLAPAGPFPVEAQNALARRLMEAVGFDFARGRLDVSHHPFCGGTPDDVRITTRYDQADFSKALMGVLHETGHALYELGLPADWRRQPVGSARGMSLHESQSLLVEMQVCRSRPFARFAAPLIRAAFGREGPAFEADNLYRLGIQVRRGLIRVDADEVTYPAHVILRYRLERAMVVGELAIADLPEAWNAGMAELVGVVPPDHRDGCLQDIHWPSGAFGYFPTYTLGALTAAQLFAAARERIAGLDAAIEAGDFRPLVEWLRAAVHSHGSRLAPGELVRQATGRPLDTTPFKAHLERRYLE